MDDLGEAVFALDTETTGLDHSVARPTEVACVFLHHEKRRTPLLAVPEPVPTKPVPTDPAVPDPVPTEPMSVEPSSSDAFGELINPGFAIPEFCVKLTGITDEMVKGARAEAAVFADLVAWVTQKAEGRRVFVVAHNARFDRTVVNNACLRAGLEAPDWTWCCTVAAARRYLEKQSFKLATLHAALGFGEFPGHRALDDARACARVYVKIAGDKSVRDMVGL